MQGSTLHEPILARVLTPPTAAAALETRQRIAPANSEGTSDLQHGPATNFEEPLFVSPADTYDVARWHALVAALHIPEGKLNVPLNRGSSDAQGDGDVVRYVARALARAAEAAMAPAVARALTTTFARLASLAGAMPAGVLAARGVLGTPVLADALAVAQAAWSGASDVLQSALALLPHSYAAQETRAAGVFTSPQPTPSPNNSINNSRSMHEDSDAAVDSHAWLPVALSPWGAAVGCLEVCGPWLEVASEALRRRADADDDGDDDRALLTGRDPSFGTALHSGLANCVTVRTLRVCYTVLL